MRVLLTSSGRRVSLLKAFKRAVSAEPGGKVLAADLDPTAPTLLAADNAHILPPVQSECYLTELMHVCVHEKVNVVIPLIDPELFVLANAKGRFLSAGVVLAVSDPECVRVANDKLLTYQHFSRLGVPSVSTMTVDEADEALKAGSLRFPVVVKPRDGSAGKAVSVCNNQFELRCAAVRVPNPIVQEFVEGIEVTIDVLGDGRGSMLGLVPRKRLKVRAGEVERGVTVDDALFRHWVGLIVESLKPFGPVNIQCFVTERGVKFSELNARFGGGYPLADAAGARFPEMLLELARGRVPPALIGQYERGLVMTRFDEAFFIRAQNIACGCELTSLPYRGDHASGSDDSSGD